MKEELDRIRAAGGGEVRYWSGGSLYPGLLDAASAAGLSVNGDWKNPATQRMEARLFGSSPWRPSGGPSAADVTAFAAHSPSGKVVYLPDGAFSRDELADKLNVPSNLLKAALRRSLFEIEQCLTS